MNMNTEIFVRNISEDQSVMWWEYLGDLQICPILSFKTDSFTRQFITVWHSKSCRIVRARAHLSLLSLCPCTELCWAQCLLLQEGVPG